MADIVIDRVVKEFGSFRALQEVSLTVNDGEFVALLGPSGCGKTTLLRIIAGLETQTAGRVVIGGQDVSNLAPRKRGLAMVFQNYAVFPHMTVFENVAFGLRMQKASQAEVKRKVERAAALLHIESYLDRYPAKLSGGQRQRVAVARALAVEPAVLLMDEPLSNLDALLRLEMRTELKAVLREAGTTTIYVTHDQTEAMGLADRIAVMYGGKIDQIGAPLEIYATPATRFVGGFIGSPPMNFIKVQCSQGQARIGDAALPCPSTGKDLELGLRGEDAALSANGSGIPFDVRVVEPMGSHLLLTGAIDGQPARIVAPPTAKVSAGERVGLTVDPARVTWIDSTTGRALARV
ncbi:ABC transporter ATP-binding protein [Microvirga sp. 3-52]|uniref:ABC transporter ATP-binding protein n=1 Tax=Microvirga sp. 3-52 TaxID=2792425 RepID=UPI001AC4D7BB|nr:ABC transporter ATP-binding protein [Microvirga sp. 3-52]MBO1908801.1 ABC transporter ATP-binding protein [Microvirga sp. 3-52]MBS7453050.1 ABC transporter ATP-binding protein [Microvirga sp. 3-52]